jgi:hypothetical protein
MSTQPSNIFQINLRKIKEAKRKLVVLIVLLLAYFVVYPYFTQISSEVESLEVQVKTLENKVNKLTEEKHKLEEVKKMITYINNPENKKKIAACLNQKKKFSECGIDLTSYDEYVIKSYFMFHKFPKTEKMDYDQKKLIKDIIYYLQNRGQLNIINFGDVKQLPKVKDVYVVPITLSVDFQNYRKFLDFLDTIENKVNLSERDLFIIKNLSYNILKYKEPQTITINMDALFYR